MKESKFVEQNKHKWIEFSNVVKSKDADPTTLSKLFVQVSDDLSYANTFFPNRKVRLLLNNISQYLYVGIYKNHRITAGNIVGFWKTTLPNAMFKARKELLLAFLIFTISMVIGMVSSANDSNFTRLILGDNYIEMTLENIKKNEPMGVYKSMGEFDMMFHITLNNIIVALITFVSGVLLAIGTVFNLFYNGVMVGSFQYFFIERGLFMESFITIWQHGTLEISSIIIAGASGITLGKGLLFPGTYGRGQSFRIAARRGMTIFAGIVPILILAAFIESFFTRYTGMNIILRLSVIIISLTFTLGYFVVYPILLYRKGKIDLIETDDVKDVEELIFKTNEINDDSNGIVLTFSIIKGNASAFFRNIILLTVAYLASIVLLINLDTILYFSDIILPDLVLYPSDYPSFFILNSLFVGALIWVNFLRIVKIFSDSTNKLPFNLSLKILLLSIVVGALIFLPFFLENYASVFLLMAILPISSFMAFVAIWRKSNIISSLAYSLKLLSVAGQKFWMIIGQIALIAIAVYFFTNSDIVQNYLQYFLYSLNFDQSIMSIISKLLRLFIFAMYEGIIISLVLVSVSVAYFIVNEVFTAENLMARINQIGKSRRTRGYEREV